MEFKKKEGVRYKFDYELIFRDIANKVIDEKSVLRELILKDLFFLVHFVMQVPNTNCGFVVDACREVEEGRVSKTLDLWAREHYKTTIITIAETVQKVLRNSEERVGIFSHTRPVAKGFLRSIKLLFENSEILKGCFEDVLWREPASESPKWSEDDGLILKRKGCPKESTIEAWGLIEGMPTSKHFTHRVYDDVETADIVESPDMIKKLIMKFDLSLNLGSIDDTERVLGTTYHHEGLLEYIRKKTDINGRVIYDTRIKAATDDGTPNGKPVLLSQEKIDELKANEYSFNCQQLLNPTPIGVRKLSGELIRDVAHKLVPADVIRIMVIDPAGDSKDGKGDSWAIGVIGIDARVDDLGAARIYIMDLCLTPMSQTEAIEEIVRMYMRNGIILKLGVEKVGLSTTEFHITQALEKRNRRISVDMGSLQILRPAGRNKIKRIEAALCWPLYNDKIFISDNVPLAYRTALREEADRFPYGHDDGLDMLAYAYDMMADAKDLIFSPPVKQRKIEVEEYSEHSWLRC